MSTRDSSDPPDIQRLIRGVMEGDVASITTVERLLAGGIPRPMVVDLNRNIATRAGITVKVTPNEAALLWKLVDLYPRHGTEAELDLAIYGQTKTATSKVVRTMMTPLRKRIEPLNAYVQNLHGRGYRLELSPI